MVRGHLLVLEGLDRSGKSTQASLLQEYIPNSRLLKFPDRTTDIGKLIDAYLKSTKDTDDHAIHLLFSANRWELRAEILALLADGVTIILDRYTLSGSVYSIAKGMQADFCMACDRGLPRPDLTLFLDLSEEASKMRSGFGEERYETTDMQRKVRATFKEMLATTGGNVIIDANRSIEELAKEIQRIVNEAGLMKGTDAPVATI